MANAKKGLMKFFRPKLVGVYLLGFIVSVVLIFPFSDLGDKVTAMILDLTQKRVFVQFENLGLSLNPQPGLRLSNVSLETPELATPLTVTTLSIAPSLSGLLSFKPGVFVDAAGIFRGNVTLSTRGGKAANHQVVDLAGTRIELRDIISLITTTIQPKGNLAFDGSFDIDTSFANQPDGSLSLSVKEFVMPYTNISLAYGFQVPLPQLKLKQIKGNVTVKNGRVTIQNLDFGEPSDQLLAKISGAMDLKIAGKGPTQELALGALDLNIDLTVQEALLNNKDVGLAWVFLDKHKKSTGAGPANFKFRVASSNLVTEPPQIQPLQ